jgi:CheY-like chemotaxis protein
MGPPYVYETWFHSHTLTRSTAEDHRSELEGAGLMLRVETPAGPLWVNGDPTRLTQVIGNLLHNAQKFTDPGGRVALRLVEEDGWAALTVEDTGIGIAPKLLPRLFEAFRQADATPERSKGGLGLGLTVVKGLVELHGGRVRAHSEGIGRGALFTFLLPLLKSEGPRGPVPSSSSADLSVRETGRIKVLIVEDGLDTAESLRLLLSLHGFEVEVAHSGSEGVERAGKFAPGAVVCDLGLPGMSGFEVAKRLRANPVTAGALLICVSGYGQPEDRRKAREAGFDEFLLKPANTDTLVRLLAVAGAEGKQALFE